nr:MAG TPA: hypothetical protein [Caudoviricetes sp.]
MTAVFRGGTPAPRVGRVERPRDRGCEMYVS